MLRNYLLVALRNFLRQWNFTIINVLGLSIGITSCIVIFLLIVYEISFDKFHSRYNNIYRVVQGVKSGDIASKNSSTPYPLAAALRNDFSDIPLITQIHFQYEVLLTVDDEKQKLKDVVFADSLFFEVFGFKVLSGNPKVELGQPGKVFLTKSLADRILKDKKISKMKIDKVELEIAGIIADPPPTSHIHFSMIVSMPSFTGDFLGGMEIDSWGMTARGFTYMVLPDKMTPQNIESRLDPFVKKYCQTEDLKNVVMNLQPLSEIHFDPEYTKTPSRVTNIAKNDLVMMGILGVFILTIACINFINLATASSEKKAKEIGVRKTLGAQRTQLAAYFLSETFLLSLVAVLISLGAAEWLLVWLNPFLEKEISINLFSNATLVVFLIGLIAGTTLLAGLYPASFLSRYNPTAVLKSRFPVGGSKTSVRKVLVVFQFIIAQVLIIGTVVVARQMTYFKSKPLGFEKEAIVNVPVPERDVTKQETLRALLENNTNIRNITFSVGAPISNNDYYTDFFLTEKGRGDGAFGTGLKGVDRHYLETYKIKLLAGRWFNESDEKKSDIRLPESDQKFVYVVNESAVKQLGFHTPEEIIGKFITSGFFGVNSEVVGVVQDFHISSLHKQIVPVIFVTSPYLYYEAGIKLNTTNFSETIKYIEKRWNEVYPDQFFEYQFLDEHLATLYKNDEKTFMLFKIFAGVSIFIGCLGLFGLISFVANQKQKEIGIRKVMGASVPSIVILFIGDFAKLVVIAFVLAAPLTWYAMNQWLQSFAYRTDISWWIFLVGFAVTIVIVLLTILYRSIRAAHTDPAVTLRNE